MPEFYKTRTDGEANNGRTERARGTEKETSRSVVSGTGRGVEVLPGRKNGGHLEKENTKPELTGRCPNFLNIIKIKIFSTHQLLKIIPNLSTIITIDNYTHQIQLSTHKILPIQFTLIITSVPPIIPTTATVTTNTTSTLPSLPLPLHPRKKPDPENQAKPEARQPSKQKASERRRRPLDRWFPGRVPAHEVRSQRTNAGRRGKENTAAEAKGKGEDRARHVRALCAHDPRLRRENKSSSGSVADSRAALLGRSGE